MEDFKDRIQYNSPIAWFVGSVISGEDRLQQFLEEEIWENGYSNKYIEIVNSICVGERIAIKSSYTRKNYLPFENCKKSVSVMAIKAIGIVTSNSKDGHKIGVKWEKIDTIREWYFYTGRSTIWRVDETDGWMQKDLIDFTFNLKNQDYPKFLLQPYWKEKYRSEKKEYNWNELYMTVTDVLVQFNASKENLLEKIEDIDNLWDLYEKAILLETDYKDEYEMRLSCYAENELVTPIEYNTLEFYKKEHFLDEVFITEDQYETIKTLLLRKKNLILQGSPGVGKTFIAKRLAYSIMGVKEKERVCIIQFHQSYSYEDFVMGYRANGVGFELKEGPFYRFCKKASQDKDNIYFFIIDEINRGNMSKIFGELFMMIESDKRGEELLLTYQETPFSIPSNVYLIGMMNTADRSLAIIDYALRRRFCFYELEPAFETSSFQNYLLRQGMDQKLVHKICTKMTKLNLDLKRDINLGPSFQIGHSYFCTFDQTDNWYDEVIKYEIQPLLKEYWFDDDNKVEYYIKELLGE